MERDASGASHYKCCIFDSVARNYSTLRLHSARPPGDAGKYSSIWYLRYRRWIIDVRLDRFQTAAAAEKNRGGRKQRIKRKVRR